MRDGLVVQELSLTEIWERILSNGTPLIYGNEVLFIFQGKANTVAVAGDHTGWEPTDIMEPNNQNDLWFLKRSFPADARIDYKLVVDGDWINDPLNKHDTLSGFGVNSTLEIPEYENRFPVDTNMNHRGEVIRNLDYYSHNLGKTMYYHLYLPSQSADQPKSIIYVLDGSEYLNLGSIDRLADFMITQGEIPASVIVLLDPAERTKEYTIYEPYRNYVIEELLPYIESTYLGSQVDNEIQRAAIGVSWGGLTAIYMAVSTPEKFNRILSQSGSFWPKEWLIYKMIASSLKQDIVFSLQTGTIGDTEEMNDALVKLLEAKGYQPAYRKFAEGHSWGNWKGHLREGLQALFKGAN